MGGINVRKQFVLYLQRLGLKPSGIKRHLQSLDYILRHCQPLSKRTFDRFIIDLQEKGLLPSYLNCLICTLRRYATFARMPLALQKYHFFASETVNVKSTMSREEVEAITTMLPYKKKVHKEVHKMWNLFFSMCATGVRPGELTLIEVENINWAQNVILLQKTKTGKPRYIPIAPNICEALRKRTEIVKSGLIFKTRYGNPLNNAYWDKEFKTRLKVLGIARPRLSVYSLRHTVGDTLAGGDESNSDVFNVAALLGHERLETTFKNYYHSNSTKLNNTVRKLPWVLSHSSPYEKLKALAEMNRKFGLEKDNRFYYRVSETSRSFDLHVGIR